eukprot:768478-Hanusia_phi.AAC.2
MRKWGVGEGKEAEEGGGRGGASGRDLQVLNPCARRLEKQLLLPSCAALEWAEDVDCSSSPSPSPFPSSCTQVSDDEEVELEFTTDAGVDDDFC